MPTAMGIRSPSATPLSVAAAAARGALRGKKRKISEESKHHLGWLISSGAPRAIRGEEARQGGGGVVVRLDTQLKD